MSALTFYTNPMSRGRIVRWMLEELGEPYATRILEYGSTMKALDYLAINPMGKVPCVVHDGVVVTEGAAICAYLADAFPKAGLAPAVEDPARGPYLRWLFFGAGPLEAAVTAKAMGWDTPDDKAATVGFGSMAHVLDTLDQVLDGQSHIAGDRFSAADLFLSAQLGWGMMFGTIEKRPAFESYVARHHARPAAKRAQEIDDALMPEQG